MHAHQPDIIYGRKFGMALTLDVFTPDNANGLGLIYVVAGGWHSNRDSIPWILEKYLSLLERGYTLFMVVLSSSPRFTIPDLVSDLHRAVRFIRYRAAEFQIDPEKLGILGMSAGGHLALMVGFTGRDGDQDDPDPVNRVSSAVAAIADFCGPTDFFNYGAVGTGALGSGILRDLRAAFHFQEFDADQGLFVTVSDTEKYLAIGREVSPVNRIHPGAPPTLAIHGDLDERVPLQQSQLLIEKLHGHGVEAELVIKSGAGHSWPDLMPDVLRVGEWFDRHLGRDGL